MNLFNHFSKFVNNTKIGDTMDLDMFLHFTIGMVITIYMLKKQKSWTLVFITVFSIGLIKEIHDYILVIGATISEAISDQIATIIYPLLVYIARFIKKKLED